MTQEYLPAPRNWGTVSLNEIRQALYESREALKDSEVSLIRQQNAGEARKAIQSITKSLTPLFEELVATGILQVITEHPMTAPVTTVVWANSQFYLKYK